MWVGLDHTKTDFNCWFENEIQLHAVYKGLNRVIKEVRNAEEQKCGGQMQKRGQILERWRDKQRRDLPWWQVVKNPLCHTGDECPIPIRELRSHMPEVIQARASATKTQHRKQNKRTKDRKEKALNSSEMQVLKGKASSRSLHIDKIS